MASRAQPTAFSEWWWTVDRLTLAALGALMLGGIVLCLAASPPVAARIGLDPFHFVDRQVLFLIPAAAVLIATSFLSPRDIRQVSLIVFAVSLVLVAATPYFGAEIKGARRWLVILGVNIQPSEFLKPAFVILIAWLFGESAKRPEMPANTMALALLIVVVALLVLQPDFGQTMLIALVWGALFYMAGMRFIWVIGLAATAGVGLMTAFYTVPHVAQRIRGFLDPASGDTFNVDIATESFIRGGWFGRGPGEGTIKRILPEGHTDFVFAVAAEEFGVVLCLILVALFAFIVIRALTQGDAQRRSVQPFRRRRAGDPVRAAIDHQHGGESAPDAGQGNDAAVHLLWRLLADLARLRHGHAGCAHPRAAACAASRRYRDRREPGVMRAPGRAPVLVAAGGTGGHLFPAEALAAALDAARHHRSSRHRPARRALWRRHSPTKPSTSSSSATLRARNPLAMARTAVVLGLGLVQALGADRPAQARGGHRLRRLSDHPAGPGGCLARRSEPDPRRQRGHRARQSAVGAARHRDRHHVPRCVPRRARLGRQGDAHRQSGSAGGRRRCGDALSGRARSFAAP